MNKTCLDEEPINTARLLMNLGCSVEVVEMVGNNRFVIAHGPESLMVVSRAAQETKGCRKVVKRGQYVLLEEMVKSEVVLYWSFKSLA